MRLTGCTGLNGHVVSAPPSRSKEAEAIRDTSRVPLQGRRARSAERYEGLRVNGSKSVNTINTSRVQQVGNLLLQNNKFFTRIVGGGKHYHMFCDLKGSIERGGSKET